MSNFAFGKIPTNLQDFFPLEVTSDDYINEAFPTNEGDGSNLPTSIPSPFARLDLVRNAFRELGKNDVNLDGVLNNKGQLIPSDNHKLVSDALDIGQLFFNYERHRDVLSMTRWNVEEELNKLRSNGNSAHSHLARTLNLFFDQDSPQNSSYNFHLFSNFYILKYKHKVIGATSPRTMFFAAPDATAIDIYFGTDRMLDNETKALYQRDEKFIKLYYALSQTAGFSEKFSELNSYIEQNLKKLRANKPEFWNSLKNLKVDEYLKDTKNLFYNDNKGTPVEIIDDLFFKQKEDDPRDVYIVSDFVINSIKFRSSIEALPLVLPVDTFSYKWIYTTDIWDLETKVFCYDDSPLKDRMLPGQGVRYPYLTMNDFLKDEIIKLPKEIHPDYYHSFGKEDAENSFMLPLTPIFFNYFTVREVVENNMINLKSINNAIEVSLSVPVRKGIITYTKLYYHSANINDNSEKRKGIIVEKSFNLSIFPPVKKQNNVPIDYYVGISDNLPDRRALPRVNFYNSTKSYERVATKEINEAERNEGNKAFEFKPSILSAERGVRLDAPRSYNSQTLFSGSFDAIVISYDSIENVLIPNFKIDSDIGGNTYQFAIDLGTTNTHIECSIPNSSSSEPFNIKKQQSQIAFLFKNSGTDESSEVREVYDAQDRLIQESINISFGQNQDMYESPFRTVMLHNAETNWKTAKVINQANIGFDYEKKTIRPNLDITSNIKWNTDEKGLKLLELTIEELLLLCKNRVLLNKGNLSETKISWLYPVSMGGQLENLERIWQEKYRKLFGDQLSNIKPYPESIAPFYEFDKKVYGALAISIDIGGGTTDVLINQKGKTELISSFKFAGNVIYGGGTLLKNNGFVRSYAKKASAMLSEQKLNVPFSILQRIVDNNKGRSEDVMSYLFSLRENKDLKVKGVDYDVSRQLALDEDAKMLFLLFYTALIYHIAEITKIQGLDIPRNLMFSGNGSKMLNILDSSRGQKKLNELSLLIFQKVFKKEDPSDLDILISENPKEMTAKGALRIAKEAEEATSEIDYVSLIRVHAGIAKNKTMHNPRRKKMAKGLTYADFDNDESVIDGVLKNYKKFIKVFSQLDDEFNFRDRFSISLNSLLNLKKFQNKDVKAKLMNAVNHMRKGRRDEDLIDETLFFYPVIALIENLSNAIEE